MARVSAETNVAGGWVCGYNVFMYSSSQLAAYMTNQTGYKWRAAYEGAAERFLTQLRIEAQGGMVDGESAIANRGYIV